MALPEHPNPARGKSSTAGCPRSVKVNGSTGRDDPDRAPYGRRPEPFRDAEEAWLWTMAALKARRDGARSGANLGRVPRPCEPDDVVKCLDQLYRRRRIDLIHARILRIWGERHTAPNPARAIERSDWRLWREALERLEWPLRAKGIVG